VNALSSFTCSRQPRILQQMRTSRRWGVLARSLTNTIALHREDGSADALKAISSRRLSDIDGRGQRHGAGSYADHSSRGQSGRCSADGSSHFGGASMPTPPFHHCTPPKHPHSPLHADRRPPTLRHLSPQLHHALCTLVAHAHSRRPSRDVHAVLMEPDRLLASSRLP
jgi:hypothetical protein